MTHEQYQRYQAIESTKMFHQDNINKTQQVMDAVLQMPDGVTISTVSGSTICLNSLDPRINDILVQALQKEITFKYQEIARLTQEQEEI